MQADREILRCPPVACGEIALYCIEWRGGNRQTGSSGRGYGWPIGKTRRTHGSWLNLIEGFFSRLARSARPHIHVASKQKLNYGLVAAIDEFNCHPVVHT
jgi:hypothetical protein